MFETTKWVRSAVSVSAVMMMAACSMTPVYQRPGLTAVPAQLPADSGAVAQTDAQPVADLPWATYFPDPHLQSLIKLALDNNRDLRVAVLNIDQLRAAYDIQKADRFPTLNAAITGAREPSPIPPYQQITMVNGGINLASYELDLFGRVKALTEAAAAQVVASEASRKTVHISLVASVASTYYALWADRWQLALTEETLRTRQDSLKLSQLKFDNGVLNELDLRTAQSTVEAARVTLAQAQRQWAQDLTALNLLLGTTAPPDLLPPKPVVDMQALTQAKDSAAAIQVVQASLWPDLSELPVGLSSDVLLQRPDIAQAEDQLIAANANIGAARADRFPRITLTGSFGVLSDSLSGLFNGNGIKTWTFSPAATMPIFDAGRTSAGVDAAWAKRDIALAQYDKAVQTAFKEVADALVARRTYADQATAQLAQAQAEAARMRLSALRYETGVASQLDLLDAQRSLFAAQQALILAQLARQQAHINVYKALGGGWRAQDASQSEAAAPPAAPPVQ